MEENTLSNEEQQEFLNAMKALDSTDSSKSIKKGRIISGKIIHFDETHVFIDLEYKLEGKVKISEFDKEPVLGNKVEVKVVGEDGEYIIVSKSLVDRDRSQVFIEEAWESGASIKGLVKESIKGGFSVSLSGTNVFCPFSQIDISRSISAEDHVGKEYDFKIIKKDRRDIVVSRKIIQEVTQKAEIEAFISNLKENDIIPGKVKNIEHFGGFVEITPGLDGFVALANMSWDKVVDPKKVFNRGDEKMFKVLAIDKERCRVDLGFKQLEDDPWGEFVEKYKVGDVVEGEVTNIKKFGVFVRVYNGVEGLVHISDLSWNVYVKSPADFAKKGAFLECKILEMDIPQRKLTLGLKQVKENPWSSVESLYPVGKPVKCLTKRILKDFAIFELPNGLEGICDISAFDWKNNVVNIKDFVKEGDTVDMIVLFIDKEKQKIKLSYKHNVDSPWNKFELEYPQGSIVNGVVKIIIEAGAIITLPDELEGFIHLSQIDMPRNANVSDSLVVGTEYPFVIREINHIKNRISLSRRDYIETQSKKEMKGYLSLGDPNAQTYNPFADLGKK